MSDKTTAGTSVPSTLHVEDYGTARLLEKAAKMIDQLVNWGDPLADAVRSVRRATDAVPRHLLTDKVNASLASSKRLRLQALDLAAAIDKATQLPLYKREPSARVIANGEVGVCMPTTTVDECGWVMREEMWKVVTDGVSHKRVGPKWIDIDVRAREAISCILREHKLDALLSWLANSGPTPSAPDPTPSAPEKVRV